MSEESWFIGHQNPKQGFQNFKKQTQRQKYIGNMVCLLYNWGSNELYVDLSYDNIVCLIFDQSIKDSL